MKTPEKIFITEAKTEDAQLVRILEELVWQEDVTNKYDIPMLVRFGYVYVAKVQDKIVGAIIAFRTKKDEVFVSDVVVHPKHQGRKIGERLYKKLLIAVKGKNVISFLDPTLIPTMNLHKKLGGKVVAEVSNPYDLKKGLETGKRLLVRIKNTI